MAIIVEEEKQVGMASASGALGWFIVLGIVLVAAYYIFFAPAPSVVVSPPTNFQVIAPIAQISLDPAGVIANSAFQALKSYIPEPTSTGPVAVGKANPFIP